MTWPDDGLPRFVVVTVSGWSESVGSTRGQVAPLSAHVLDRAYCDQIVRAFVPNGGLSSRHCLRNAERACERLNAQDDEA